MSTSTLPKIRDAQKRAEDSRYYMLRANRQMTTLALNRIQDQLESERVDFNARLKQESLDLKMELLRRAEEEKAVLKADEDMLFDVNVKIAKRRKKRADEQQQQRERKKEIKRRVHEKRKDKRFEKKAIPEETTSEAPTTESSGGGHRPSLFPIIAQKKLPSDLDMYMPPTIAHEKREPKIKLNRDLIFPNARKPQLYKQLMSQNFKREVSRINEKSLRKLREKYRMLAAEEETKQAPEDVDTPYISSVAHMMYQVAEDSRQSHLNRILRRVADTRETLRLTAPRMPLSDRLKQSLEECVRRRKKRRRREEKTSESLLRSAVPEAVGKPEEAVAKSEEAVGKAEEAVGKAEEAVGKVKEAAERDEASTERKEEGEGESLATAATSVEKKEEIQETEGETKEEANVKEKEPSTEGDNQRDESSDEEEPAEVLKSILSGGSEKVDEKGDSSSEGKIWRLPASSGRSRSDDSAMKRVTLKGPNLTPIQSTEVSPATTREPTLVPQLSAVEEEAAKLDPAVWKDVLQCRYIRGYDPPEMRIPATSAAEFIFGDEKEDKT